MHAITLKNIKDVLQDFWKLRPQVGVAVNAILFKNLNISGAGGGNTLKVGVGKWESVSQFLNIPLT